MTEAEILQAFQNCGAVLDGHFRLSSGLHSPVYVQCALVLQLPRVAERLCRGLARKWAGEVDVVIGPAMGAVTLAYELGRALGVRAFFTERVDGRATLRRGFALEAGERVLVCEDVLTTGGSAAEVIEQVVKPAGARLAGVAALIDRGGAARFGECGVGTLLRVDMPTYSPEECPLCRDGIPLEAPGSRKAKAPDGKA